MDGRTYPIADSESVLRFFANATAQFKADGNVAKLVASGAPVDPSFHHYIRLERVHVNEPEQPGILSVPGTVAMREYYGLYIKYYINVGSQTLKVMERNDGVRIYDEGDTVTVNLNPADLMSYAPSGEEAAK